MHRRTLLKIGTGSAVLLGAAAAGLALIEPGMRDGRMTAYRPRGLLVGGARRARRRVA